MVSSPWELGMCSLCCGLSRMPLHTERLNEKKITKPVRPSALAWIRRRRWTSVAVTLPSAVAFLIYMGFTQLSTACSIRTFLQCVTVNALCWEWDPQKWVSPLTWSYNYIWSNGSTTVVLFSKQVFFNKSLKLPEYLITKSVC